MSCYGCQCNFCARNAELAPRYVTPGEISSARNICYVCDECFWLSVDPQKNKSQWRPECPGYVEARKYAEARALHLRGKFKVIEGTLEGKDADNG